jgi:hypothetical protein
MKRFREKWAIRLLAERYMQYITNEKNYFIINYSTDV